MIKNKKKIFGLAGAIFLISTAILFAFMFNFFNNEYAEESFAEKNSSNLSEVSKSSYLNVNLNKESGWIMYGNWTDWQNPVAKQNNHSNITKKSEITESDNMEPLPLPEADSYNIYEVIGNPRNIDFSQSNFSWELKNKTNNKAAEISLTFYFVLSDGKIGVLTFYFDKNGSTLVTNPAVYQDGIALSEGISYNIPENNSEFMAPIWEEPPVPVTNYKITGSVYDDSKGESSHLAGVNVFYKPNMLTKNSTYTAITLADGTFTIDDINPSDLNGFLTLELDEYAFPYFNVKESDFVSGVNSMPPIAAFYPDAAIYYGPYSKKITSIGGDYDKSGQMVRGPIKEETLNTSLFQTFFPGYIHKFTLLDDYSLVYTETLDTTNTNIPPQPIEIAKHIVEYTSTTLEGHNITSVSVNGEPMEINKDYQAIPGQRLNIVFNYDEQPIVPPVDPDPVIEEEVAPTNLELTAQTADPISLNAICVLAILFFVSWTICILKRSRARRHE